VGRFSCYWVSWIQEAIAVLGWIRSSKSIGYVSRLKIIRYQLPAYAAFLPSTLYMWENWGQENWGQCEVMNLQTHIDRGIFKEYLGYEYKLGEIFRLLRTTQRAIIHT
jgi:hypothetical protein